MTLMAKTGNGSAANSPLTQKRIGFANKKVVSQAEVKMDTISISATANQNNSDLLQIEDYDANVDSIFV